MITSGPFSVAMLLQGMWSVKWLFVPNSSMISMKEWEVDDHEPCWNCQTYPKIYTHYIPKMLDEKTPTIFHRSIGYPIVFPLYIPMNLAQASSELSEALPGTNAASRWTCGNRRGDSCWDNLQAWLVQRWFLVGKTIAGWWFGTFFI